MLEAASITWVFCSILFLRRMEDVLPASRDASHCQGFSPAEGILAVAPDIYSTPAVYLPDGTQVAWPTDNSILTQPLNPDFWYPIDLGQYLDANGNSKCEPGGATQWIRWAETHSPL